MVEIRKVQVGCEPVDGAAARVTLTVHHTVVLSRLERFLGANGLGFEEAIVVESRDWGRSCQHRRLAFPAELIPLDRSPEQAGDGEVEIHRRRELTVDRAALGHGALWDLDAVMAVVRVRTIGWPVSEVTAQAPDLLIRRERRDASGWLVSPQRRVW